MHSRFYLWGKNMNKEKGQELIEFSLISALVCIGVIFALTILGQNITTVYNDAVNALATMNNGFNSPAIANPVNTTGGSPTTPTVTTPTATDPVVDTTTTPDLLSDASLPTTTSLPTGNYAVSNGDTMDISVDGITLTGVPKDFQNLINTIGPNGTTETILGLIEQMAVQMDDPATPQDEGEDFRDMANLGHFIADYEADIELKAAGCNLQSNPSSCMSSELMYTNSLGSSVPSSLSSILSSYSLQDNHSDQMAQMLDFGIAANRCKSGGSGCSPTSNPIHAFYKQYDTVMSSSDYSDSSKAIIKQLYTEIASIGTNMKTQMEVVSGATPSMIAYDPVTGNPMLSNAPTSVAINDILHPSASVVTDLDSSLICTTGVHSDDGTVCQ